MGYSHAIHRPDWQAEPRDGFGRLAMSVQKIIVVAADYGLKLTHPNHVDEPIITEGLIAFGGPDGGEPFWFPAQPEWSDWHFEATPDKPRFSCESIKTRGRPYDAAVCAALIETKRIFGQHVEIMSDGLWGDPLWTAGAMIWASAFDAIPDCPWADQHSIHRGL